MDYQLSNSIEGWKATCKKTGKEAKATFDEGKETAIERLKEITKPARKVSTKEADTSEYSKD